MLRHLDLDYRAWRYRWKVEPHEIAFVRAALRPGDRAIDIGAHKGAFTYWMRRAVGPSGKLWALEPQPVLAAQLAGVVADRGWSNVAVLARAASSAPGKLALTVPGGAPSPSATLESRDKGPGDVAVEVEVITVDSLVPAGQPLRLIKCDVEGHELEVFRGARRVLAEARPILLFECEARHHAGASLAPIFEHLESLGYRGWFFWGSRRIPVAELDLALHQDPAKRPYANNFVFEPEPDPAALIVR